MSEPDTLHALNQETAVSAAQPSHALLLNADFQPIKVIDWERAVTMLIDDIAEIVEEYAGHLVRSVTTAMPWPAVLRLKRYAKSRVRMRFNRQNVLARDGWTCGYCGVAPRLSNGRPRIEDLTLDHVVPRAQASSTHTVRLPWNGKIVPVTCWENVITCCGDCNSKKANRTPNEAGFKLRGLPRNPSAADVLRMTLRKYTIPREWISYLPKGAAAWGGGGVSDDYWTVELDPD